MVGKSWRLALLLSFAVPSVAMAQSGTQASGASSNAVVDRFYDDVGTYYETAGVPQLQNDPVGRLRIYRETLRRLEAGSAAVKADPRYASQRLFYATAVAGTMAQTPERSQALAMLDRLLPEAEALVAEGDPRPGDYRSLAALSRARGQLAMQDGDLQRALPLFRRAAAVSRILAENQGRGGRDDLQRELAVDLDNLSAMEAAAGNREQADTASLQALEMFREQAQRNPNIRAAQGSLLISLVRRIDSFNAYELLDEADRQIATMRARNMLTDNYARIPELLAQIRSEQRQRR